MRIGTIADIHGDIEGLQLALDFLESQRIDQIVCAGDLIGKGPDSNGVIRKLQTQPIFAIPGNHDQDTGEIASLDANAAEYLLDLPRTLALVWENKRILVAHGVPWSDMVYLFPTSERHVYKRVSREVQADVVILGHTHVPMLAYVDRVWICNPGSVCGTYSSGSRTCGILTLPACSFQVFKIDSGQEVEIPHLRMIR
jgi:putative phosphoesterase